MRRVVDINFNKNECTKQLERSPVQLYVDGSDFSTETTPTPYRFQAKVLQRFPNGNWAGGTGLTERGKQEPVSDLSPIMFQKATQIFGPPGKDLTTIEAFLNGVVTEFEFNTIEPTMASMHILVAIA